MTTDISQQDASAEPRWSVIPIVGLTPIPDFVELDHGELIRIPDDRREHVLTSAGITVYPILEFAPRACTHAYALKWEAPDLTPFNDEMAIGVALRVAFDRIVWCLNPIHTSDSDRFETIGKSGVLDAYQPETISQLVGPSLDPAYRPDADGLSGFRETHTIVRKALMLGEGPISTACDQLMVGDATSPQRGPRRLFEYVVGLEALLLWRGPKLSRRFSVFLSEIAAAVSGLSKTHWFKVARRLYGFRSDYAHGNRSRVTQSNISEARTLLRLVLFVAAQLDQGSRWYDRRHQLYESLTDNPSELRHAARRAATAIELERKWRLERMILPASLLT